MNRKLLIEAILKVARDSSREIVLDNVLKRLSDTNLLAFAIDLGIDTDAVLASIPKYPPVPCEQHGGSLTCHCGEPV